MLFTIVEIVAVTVMCCMASVHYVHTLQMERYQIPAYRQWVNKNRDRILKENVLWAFVSAILSLYLPFLLSMFMTGSEARKTLSEWLALAIFTGVTLWIAVRDYRWPCKKPFVLTHRVRRLALVLAQHCLRTAFNRGQRRAPRPFLRQIDGRCNAASGDGAGKIQPAL